jgi:hypothetical protein
MRLEFIHPIYLPPLSESFLRKDFNFAAYLGFAYGKTLQGFFNTSWVALLVTMIFSDLYRLVYYSNGEWWGTLVNLVIPIVFLLIFLAYYFSFRKIQKVLFP